MKTLALVATLSVVAAAQSGMAPFAGSWIAQFEGRTFVRLELTTTNGSVTGGISLGHFEVDKQGALRRVDAPPSQLTPIVDATQRGTILAFSTQEGDNPDRFEFRVVDKGRAELQLILSEEDRRDLAESGIGVPRPIALTRR